MQTDLPFHATGVFRTDSSRRELVLLVIAGVFLLINSVAISFVSDGKVVWIHLYPFVVWLIVFAAVFVVLTRLRPVHDPYLLPIIALLSGWGLVILDRLLPAFLHRQVIWLVLAALAMLVASLLPATLWYFRRYRYLWLLTGLLLLAATLVFGVNPSGFGAELWLRVPIPGRVFFQPSELLKLIMIIFLAGYFEEQELLHNHGLSSFRFGSIRSIAPLLAMWSFSLILLIWQRDLGAAALFFVVFLAMLYLATGNWRYVLGGLLLMALASMVAYLIYDVVTVRFSTWWNPWPVAREEGYQIVQSLYAIASGHLIGQGVGLGFPNFVPVAHTDFAFAAIAEEWGLIGGLIVVVSFTLISYRGFKIAMNVASTFRMYLAAGIAVVLGIQSILILGGITRILPLTGVTLPFVSYGGSSLVMSFLMVGFLLNLSSSSYANGHSVDFGGNSPSFGSRVSKQARDRLRHLSLITILAFSTIFLLVVYWTAIRGAAILERDDNPRLVEAEKRIHRGSILDSNGVLLAESVESPDGVVRRVYHPDSGPGTGYYSFDHGSAGIENAVDDLLRGADGDPWESLIENDLLHEQQEGQNVRLTLDASWQELANDALDGKQGAIIMVSLPDNAIRALVTYPTYDANTLDQQFETLTNDLSGPLLNRPIQGQYQPGLAIQPFILAMANEANILDFEDVVGDSAGSISINGTELECAGHTSPLDSWADVLTNRCPGSMTSLSSAMDDDSLYEIYKLFGLTTTSDLGIGERADEQFAIENLELALLGQENLAVTPLQIVLALATLANDGVFYPADLIQAVQDQDGSWRSPTGDAGGYRVISGNSANQTLQSMSGENGLIEHSVMVLSGPSGSTNSWYLGLAPASAPRYAMVVIVEESDNLNTVEEIGRSIFKEVLEGK